MHGSLYEVQPVTRSFKAATMPRRRRLPLGMIAVVELVLAAAIVWAAGGAPEAPAQTPAALPEPPPDWVDIPRPIELFDLSAPDFTRLAKVYAARRHRTGGGRQDILTFGKLSGDEPFFRLVLYRVGREAAPQAPLFVDLARSAATSGWSITRSLNPAELATRFGNFEVADLDLAAGTAAPTHCLGFRGAPLEGRFRFSGFACGTAGKPMSRPALTCLLDRLDLNSARNDNVLAAFFANTELRRDPTCAGTGLAPTPVHANWIDQDDAPPPLKLRKER